MIAAIYTTNGRTVSGMRRWRRPPALGHRGVKPSRFHEPPRGHSYGACVIRPASDGPEHHRRSRDHPPAWR